MSGHSKWAKVKHFKGAIDAKRGKIFSKLGREITIAAKIGGGDPDMNPRLRMVLLKCRTANMPRDNIERAIKKGTGGGEGANFEDLTYEIYGPHGVALLVEVSTDNRNRTASDIRSIVTKNNGSIATAGSVSRLFQRKGQIIVSREAASEDQLMELAIEAGAEDFKAEPQGYEILTEPANFEAVHKQIEAKGIKCEAAEITSLPTLTVPLTDAAVVAAVNKLIEALEEHDDVKEVYSNAEFPDEVKQARRRHEGIKRRFPARAVAGQADGGDLPASPLVYLSAIGAVRVVRALHDWVPEGRHEPGQSGRAQPEVSPEFSPATSRNFPSRATWWWSWRATTLKKTGSLSSASPPKCWRKRICSGTFSTSRA